MCVCVCLSVCLSECVCVCVCLSVCLPACLPVCLPACLPACLPVCLCLVCPCITAQMMLAHTETAPCPGSARIQHLSLNRPNPPLSSPPLSFPLTRVLCVCRMCCMVPCIPPQICAACCPWPQTGRWTTHPIFQQNSPHRAFLQNRCGQTGARPPGSGAVGDWEGCKGEGGMGWARGGRWWLWLW